MRASATVLSNNILVRGRKENIDISPMKLQKLLYYVCVEYVKQSGKLPISEHFEVWKYGPVLASVYAEFKPFGSNPITSYAQNAKGKSKMVDESCNPLLKKCLDTVWDMFKNDSAITLSMRTHQEGSGWYTAYQEGRNAISTKDMSDDTTIEKRSSTDLR